MKRKELISCAALRQLCIDREWFTCGTNEQYDRLFEMARDYNHHDNENDRVFKLLAMARLIWSCSSSAIMVPYDEAGIMDAIQHYCISISYEAA